MTFGEDDLDLLCSIDEPAEGTVVTGELRLRGWAQDEWYLQRKNIGDKNASFFSAGMDGSILGNRVDRWVLDDVWNEYQATINIQNAQRQKLIDLLTFSVTNPVETVPQGGAGSDFEEASEYGVPQGTRPTSGVFQLGFSFKWYDIATRFTWRFLAEASRAQVDAVHASVLEADNRLIFRDVMRTLFRNTNRTADINGQNYTVYSFYNGDGTVPPPYKNNTFNGTYTHFRSSGAATVDSGDLDEIITSFSKLGYGAENGTQLFVMVNEAQSAAISIIARRCAPVGVNGRASKNESNPFEVKTMPESAFRRSFSCCRPQQSKNSSSNTMRRRACATSSLVFGR